MKYLLICTFFLLFWHKADAQYDPDYEGRFNQNLDAITTKALVSRDDLLYHAETAYTTYKGAGNVSLLSETRVAVSNKWELSTRLAADIVAPMLALKRLWFSDNRHNWYISSKFNIQSAYTGYRLAQKKGYDKFVEPDIKIPIVGEFGHEFLITYAKRGDLNCTKGDAYLLFTFGFGTYLGINFNSTTLQQPEYHLLANRTATLIDNGNIIRFKLWADGILNNWLIAHGGIFFYTGSLEKAFATEIHGELEAFIFKTLSFKVGFMSSFAKYNNVKTRAFIVPMADISVYFGKKRNRDHSLFSPTGRLF